MFDEGEDIDHLIDWSRARRANQTSTHPREGWADAAAAVAAAEEDPDEAAWEQMNDNGDEKQT